jgi:hypothetical protein
MSANPFVLHQWYHWVLTHEESMQTMHWEDGRSIVDYANVWMTWQANLFSNEGK